MSAFTIRIASEAEADRIADTYRRAWSESTESPPEVRAGAWWGRMHEPAGLTLIAEVDGRVAGFCCAMTPSRDADAATDAAEIAALHVEPENRRAGLARALLTSMADQLFARGFRAATLWVRAGNHAACSLYAAVGWKPDGGRKATGGAQQLRLRAPAQPSAEPRTKPHASREPS